MKHEYADILQAIAEDKDVKLESRYNADKPWTPAIAHDLFWALSKASFCEFRIAPKTIRIGDMDVPEPMRESPAVGTKYWFIDFYGAETVAPFFWSAHKADNRLLKLGLCHLTEAAARTHAEALIKVSGGVL